MRTGNNASRRLIEKVGFRYVGRREEDVWRHGNWHGRLFYELTVSEWDDRTAVQDSMRE